MIVYRDGATAKEMGKLGNFSLHVSYTSLVSVYVNYSLRTLILAILCRYNYSVVRILAITTSTHLPLLLYTVNINLCGIVYSVLHGIIIIINCRGSTHLDWCSLIQTLFLEVTFIN